MSIQIENILINCVPLRGHPRDLNMEEVKQH